jgi:hypothetical protein
MRPKKLTFATLPREVRHQCLLELSTLSTIQDYEVNMRSPAWEERAAGGHCSAPGSLVLSQCGLSLRARQLADPSRSRRDDRPVMGNIRSQWSKAAEEDGIQYFEVGHRSLAMTPAVICTDYTG